MNLFVCSLAIAYFDTSFKFCDFIAFIKIVYKIFPLLVPLFKIETPLWPNPTIDIMCYISKYKLKHTKFQVWTKVENFLLRNKRFKVQKRKIIFISFKYFLCISWRPLPLQNKIISTIKCLFNTLSFSIHISLQNAISWKTTSRRFHYFQKIVWFVKNTQISNSI